MEDSKTKIIDETDLPSVKKYAYYSSLISGALSQIEKLQMEIEHNKLLLEVLVPNYETWKLEFNAKYGLEESKKYNISKDGVIIEIVENS